MSVGPPWSFAEVQAAAAQARPTHVVFWLWLLLPIILTTAFVTKGKHCVP